MFKTIISHSSPDLMFTNIYIYIYITYHQETCFEIGHCVAIEMIL